jgi:hypothetical protein
VEDDEEEDEDTPASRLVTVVLKHLLKALPAKDKTVRFRACQLVAMMTNGLGELEYVDSTRRCDRLTRIPATMYITP